ncbi:Na-translocating system protein MpsC family protein [Saccharibacillus sacchari]|uniref:Na-translocating system protein MpsC family protein n=1 Tax=Saccharibacillus sacchari TaxID=456493 RepID=A0ACC6PBP1_9BACL
MTLKKLTHSIQQTVFSLFENNFGKVPEAVTVSANERCLIIRIEGFLGSIIETMIAENSYGALGSTRELIVGYMLSQLRADLSSEQNLSVSHFYYDWNDEDLSCIISVVLDEEEHYASDHPYPGKEDIHREVSEITENVQKVPAQLNSFWVDDFLVIIRRGLLIELEKALLEDGQEAALRSAKRKVEKKYFADSNRFVDLLGRKPVGVYLDWAFDLDSSMLVYAFVPDSR